MTQLRIDEITPSKSGKAWRVKIGDKWYGANKDTIATTDKGRVADMEIEASDYGPWIKKAKFLEAVPSFSDSGPSKQAPAPSQTMSAPYWLPFASNVVAHAISAGIVKEPADIKAWVLAAKEAAQKATGGDIDF